MMAYVHLADLNTSLDSKETTAKNKATTQKGIYEDGACFSCKYHARKVLAEYYREMAKPIQGPTLFVGNIHFKLAKQ